MAKKNKFKPTLVSHHAISQGNISYNFDFWLSHPFITKCQWNIWILIPDIYTNGHQWWLPAHTILWKHEPEDWEKDMRGGSAIREMYLKCFHSIYCCWHFFSLGRPDTVKPANCKFTWTYDLPFSDHMPFGTLCLDMKEDISDPAFTNWFASLLKENAICGILIFHITGY